MAYKPSDRDSGRSIILVRTEKGKSILHAVQQAGYIVLKKITYREVVLAQDSLLQKRKHLWGRLPALKLLLIPAPKIENFHFFKLAGIALFLENTDCTWICRKELL